MSVRFHQSIYSVAKVSYFLQSTCSVFIKRRVLKSQSIFLQICQFYLMYFRTLLLNTYMFTFFIYSWLTDSLLYCPFLSLVTFLVLKFIFPDMNKATTILMLALHLVNLFQAFPFSVFLHMILTYLSFKQHIVEP